MKTNIKINKITPPTAEVLMPDGSHQTVNEYEFNDLRIQIKNNKATGFKVVVDGEERAIDEDGRINDWTNLFTIFDKQLTELIMFD